MPRIGQGELYAMPLNTDQWRKITQLLSLEEEGALMRACIAAWNAPVRGAPPATLADDADAWERLFSRKWSKVEPLIRQHFRPISEDPGTLRCTWLAEVYENALARYTARAKGGRVAASVRRPHVPSEMPLFSQNARSASRSTHAQRDAQHHAQRTQLKPKLNGVLTPHTDAATTALELPAVPQLTESELAAWEGARPENAAAVLSVVDELCAHFEPKEQDRAKRLLRRQALLLAYARSNGVT